MKEKPFPARHSHKELRKRVAGERARRDNPDLVGIQWNPGDLAALEPDQRLARDGCGEAPGERPTVHRQRRAAGYPRLGGDPHRDGAHSPQLFLEEPRGAAGSLGLQRIAAHQFADLVGLVSGCAL